MEGVVKKDISARDAETWVITGAAGALGSAVVRLAQASGHHVVAVDLPGSAFPETEQPYTIRPGDLTQRRFCRQAVEGATVVVNAAASNLSDAAPEALELLNVEAVRWLYEAAEDAGAARFIQLSSAALYKPRRGVLDEDAETSPTSNYLRTKEEAERFFSRQRGGLAWTILRPSLIYGPRVRSFGATLLLLPPLLRLFVSYPPSLTGGPRNNWVHVEDVARAVLCVAHHPGAVGEIFNVSDNVPLSSGEILSATIQAYGFDIGPMLQFPHGLLMTSGRLMDLDLLFKTISNLSSGLWQRIVQRHDLSGDLSLTLSRSTLDYISGDRVVGNAKLKALGWSPIVGDLRDGIGETVRWYQDANWLPDYRQIREEDLQDVKFGLSFSERLAGKATSSSDRSTSPVTLELEATFPSVRRLILDRCALLEGTIRAESLFGAQPITGTMTFSPTGTLAYQFGFEGVGGASYRFRGEKRLSLFKPLFDFGVLRGRVSNARGEESAKVELKMGNSRDALKSLLTGIKIV